MKQRKRKLTTLFLITATLLFNGLLPAHSGNLTLRQFAMYASPKMVPESCRLVERHSQEKSDAIQFQGSMDEYGCNVSIPKERYEQLFQFCFQSGINVHEIFSGNSFECFVEARKDDYLFLAHISKSAGKDSQVMCYFSCVAR